MRGGGQPRGGGYDGGAAGEVRMDGRACSFLCSTLSYGDGLGRGRGDRGAAYNGDFASFSILRCGRWNGVAGGPAHRRGIAGREGYL